MPLLGAGAFFDGSGSGPSGPLGISGTPVTAADNGDTISWTADASGGSLPYVFSVHAGTLPSGITLNSSTGVVGGTLTEGGVFTGIIIRVTDGAAATADLAAFDMSIFPGIPAGAIALLDFKWGRYFVSGVEYAVTAEIGGSGFNAATQITARGLEVNDGLSNQWPKLINEAFTLIRDLSAGMSYVVQMDVDSPAPQGPFVIWEDVAQGSGPVDQYFAADFYLAGGDGGTPTFELYDWYDLSISNSFASLVVADFNRFGFTLGLDNGDSTWKFSISANGETPVSQDVTYSADQHLPSGLATTIEIGGWKYYSWDWYPYTPAPPNGAFISRIEFYPVADEAGLQVLTAAGVPLSGDTSGVTLNALVGSAYSAAIIAWGGVPGYSFSVHSGSLPAGLSLDSATGIISGTPTGAESDTIVIRVTDANAATLDLPSFVLTVQSVLAIQTSHQLTSSSSFSVNIGDPNASRIVVVAVHTFDILAAPPVSLDGTPMQLAVWEHGSPGDSLSVYYLPFPTGTSATLSITAAGFSANAFEVVAVYGTGSSPLLEHTASNFATGPTGTVSCSIDVNTGGVTLLFGATYNSDVGGVSFDHGSMLDDFVSGRIGAGVIYGASNTTLSVTATFDASTYTWAHIAAASFGP